MATKNDKVILNLKNEIDKKKKAITTGNRFIPITNCSITINGVKQNIHSMTINSLLFAIGYVKSLQNGLNEIIPNEKLVIDNFKAEEWIEDLKCKYYNLNQSLEKERLRKLEEKLHSLLSTDTKVDLEIQEIMKSI